MILNIFIFLSVIAAIGYAFYVFFRIKSCWKECITLHSPRGLQYDYSILRDCLFRTILVGISFYLFLHCMYFGVQGKWLLESNSYMKNVIIVMGGIYYIVNIFQSSINYVNSEIDKRMESNNTQKEILYLKEKR